MIIIYKAYNLKYYVVHKCNSGKVLIRNNNKVMLTITKM